MLALLLVPRQVDLPLAWLPHPGLLGRTADARTPLSWLLEHVSDVALLLPLGWVLARVPRPLRAAAGGVARSAACVLTRVWSPNRAAPVPGVRATEIGVRVARRAHARREVGQCGQDQNGAPLTLSAVSIGRRHPEQFGVSSDTASSSASRSMPVASASLATVPS